MQSSAMLGCRWILLAALVACSNRARPGADLVVSVTTSAPSISPGESLRVQLEVRNTGDRPDSIVVPSLACPVLWRIDGPGGVYAGPDGVRAPNGRFCPAHGEQIQLAGGQAVRITYVWTGQRGTLGINHELPLGRYWIRAATAPAGDIHRLVQSSRVAVDLVAPH